MTATKEQREKDHEEFKSRLVNDVFGQEMTKVAMDKVTMLIWHFRDDPRVVQYVAQFVAKYSGLRDVFDGIEFYLPQLAHMIIHLEANWDDAILERFALIISQHSLHFALQFHWILEGALEDYQPEMHDGTPNPMYNQKFYTRCVKLLSNMERCVVYGTPRTNELRRMYEKGKISEQEYELLELADRRFNAAKITEGEFEANLQQVATVTEGTATNNSSSKEGELYYKRRVRTRCYKRKTWKLRYFIISDRMLYCYRQKNGELIRAMPLEDALAFPTPQGKYPYMIDVTNQDYFFQMRASSQSDMEDWVNRIREEASCSPLDFFNTLTLTSVQKERYNFYKGEKEFVRNLCGIAEKLRFEERDERKKLAPGYVAELQIPSSSYIPMCNSTDIWRRVCKPIPTETRVFNTKERCPMIMYFLTQRGEGRMNINLDIAEYLKQYLDLQNDENNNILTKTKLSSSNADIVSPVLTSRKKPVTTTVEHNNSIEIQRCETKEDMVQEHDHKRSMVWHNIEQKLSMKMKNLQATQGSIKELPSVLVKKMQHVRSQRSSRAATASGYSIYPLKSVRIIDSARDKDDDSILSFQQDNDEDAADILPPHCFHKAKAIICGGECWTEKKERMLAEGSIDDEKKKHDGSVTEVVGVIAKSNDDVRQEVFVMQMIHYYKSVFINQGLPIWLHTYRILSTSKYTGLIEIINDAVSIDGLKKADGYPGSLLDYFIQVYGPKTSQSFQLAQRNFMLSLVGYSLVSYLLGLKDRHNGNIMIDTHGHLIMIDFGFAMGMAPGHEWSFERAPFKITKEYLDVITCDTASTNPQDSSVFKEFQRLFVAGFEATRANSQMALGLVEIMMYKSNFPCFSGARYGGGVALKRFQERLMLDVPNRKIKRKALELIGCSIGHIGTYLYDQFQLKSNGLAP